MIENILISSFLVNYSTMVHNCAIISCPLHNRRNIRKGNVFQLLLFEKFLSLFSKGLLFHSFPVDQHRFELWRQTVFNHCSQTLSISKHSKICYRHFHPDDYIANQTGITRYLKATAVPSIFNQIDSNTTLLNNHLLTSSNTNQSTKLNTISETTSTSLLILPSNSSSSIVVPTSTNTKAKRLLNTIDKLHQIQNANKVIMKQNIILDNKQIKKDEDDKDKRITSITNDNNHLSDNLLEKSQPFIIDHHQNTIQEQQTIRMPKDGDA